MLIHRSVRCFKFGLLSWLPILGLPLAILAVMNYWKARRLARGAWNPASRYLLSGLIIASFGGLLSTILLCILLFRLVSNMG